MNDFTKEELNYLFETILNATTEYNEPNIAYEVRDKLKSMLDNYCEHEWACYFNVITGQGVRCQKCKKELLNE